MAYTVPQFRIFQEFTESIASTTSTMAACIIAPHYGLHRFSKESEQAVLGTYVPGVGFDNAVYPDKAAGSVIDVDSVKVFIKDAVIGRLTLTQGGDNSLTADGGNKLETNTVLHTGNGSTATINFVVGDPVLVYRGETLVKQTKITGFFPEKIAAKVGEVVATRAGEPKSTSEASISGTYSGKVATKYVIEILENVAETAAISAGTPLKYRLSTSNNADVSTTGTSDSATVVLGSFGLSCTFGAGTLNAGDSFEVEVTPATKGAYKTAIFADLITGVTAEEPDVKFIFGKVEDIEVNMPDYVTADANTISVGAAVKDSDGNTVYGGSVIVEYKELLMGLTRNVYDLGSVTMVESTLGPVDPENPLSLMVYKALQNSNNTSVYYIAVASDDVAGYSDALARVDLNTNVYSLVPYNTSQEVLDLFVAYIDEASSAVNMNWKIGWFGCDVPSESVVLSQTLDGKTLHASVDGRVATIPTAALESVVGGDILRITIGYEADGTPITQDFTIDTQIGEDELQLTTTSETQYNNAPAEIVHVLDSAEVAEAVASKSKYYNNRRIRNIYADGVYLSSDSNTRLSNAYVAAALAGLRSGSAPHQPLTRVELVGFALDGKYSFTLSQLNQMAEGGTWLVCEDDGVVYTRHQLTTDTTNYDLREDSKTTNADEISKYYRTNLDNYYGRVNISEDFIAFLRTVVDGVSINLTTREYSVLLGPQVLSAESCEIVQSDMVTDALVVRIPINTPEPLNYFDVYLTIS